MSHDPSSANGFCLPVIAVRTSHLDLTSMSVLLIVGPKCTLAASHAALVSHGGYADGTDRRTDRQMDGHQTVTLRFC